MASEPLLLPPAELARVALRRIAELKLPPTPELFARHYYAAPGAPPAPAPAGQGVPLNLVAAADPHLAGRVEDIVAQASRVTRDLTDSVSLHSSEVAASLEGLVSDAVIPTDAVELLQAVVASAKAMHQTMMASHAELVEARRSLSTIQVELQDSRHLLQKDPLTGTDNRRAMSAILEREMARSRRDNEPLSVAMVDIDHFKKINDTHGHATGDAALIHLTQIARAILRGNDAFVRYGGEEFVLVLVETGLLGGVHVCERLQLALAKQPLVHHGQQIAMSFSAGVSTLADEDTEATLLERADKALYEAKRTGRNRVLAAR
jgi:diguanylate cyclase